MGEEATAAPLEPLAAEDWGEPEYAAYGVLLGVPGEAVPRAGSGHRHDPLAFDVVGVLVRHPELARSFLRFNAHLLQRGELTLRHRELAILRVAARRRSRYEWAEHVRTATDAGFTAADIDSVAAHDHGFDGADGLVLRATDELLDEGRVDPVTWTASCDQLGLHQAMELLFVVGTYAMLAMAFETWGLQPQPGAAELPPHRSGQPGTT